jgi:hypothetical protein
VRARTLGASARRQAELGCCPPPRDDDDGRVGRSVVFLAASGDDRHNNEKSKNQKTIPVEGWLAEAGVT